MSLFMDLITVDPNACPGQPCVEGTPIMVCPILNYLANGESIEAILAASPKTTTFVTHVAATRHTSATPKLVRPWWPGPSA
jgi:hypothetical protein